MQELSANWGGLCSSVGKGALSGMWSLWALGYAGRKSRQDFWWIRESVPTSLSVAIWWGTWRTVNWNLMLCKQIWYQVPKVSFLEGLSIGNPEFRERGVLEKQSWASLESMWDLKTCHGWGGHLRRKGKRRTPGQRQVHGRGPVRRTCCRSHGTGLPDHLLRMGSGG